MKSYQQNAKWLTYFAPFRALSVSAAYLTPFFMQNGLNLSQILLLQSIFSVSVVLWELPSGLVADRLGRAFSIKLSARVAAAAMIAYGFSHHFWQFAVCELVLALANGLISGVDTALLIDSLKASDEEQQFVKISQRINAFGFAATAVGVPLAVVLVKYVNLSATLVADGLLTLVGAVIVTRLVEAPRYNGGQEAVRLSAWHAIRQLGSNVEARWLVTLGVALSTATYLGFWLSAPYYQSMGIPVSLLGVILAIRSLWKAVLSHRIKQGKHLERNMVVYATLAGLVYLGLATQQLWLIWVVLGHDVIQALFGQPLTAKLNEHMHHEYRATMNSLVNLVQRLVFSLSGPLVGLLVDKTSLRVGFLVTGAICSFTAFTAIARLHRFRTFK